MSDVIEVWRDHANDPKAMDGYAHIPTSDLRVIMDRLTTAERERDEARREREEAQGHYAVLSQRYAHDMATMEGRVEALRHRAERDERAERVVEAAKAWANELSEALEDQEFNAFHRAEDTLLAAVRALDAATATPSDTDGVSEGNA